MNSRFSTECGTNLTDVQKGGSIPEYHIFPSSNRTNLYFWYYDPETTDRNKQLQRSCKTPVMAKAKAYAENYLYDKYHVDKSKVIVPAVDAGGTYAGYVNSHSALAFVYDFLIWKSKQKRQGGFIRPDTISALRDTLNQFSKYLKECHPSVKQNHQVIPAIKRFAKFENNWLVAA